MGLCSFFFKTTGCVFVGVLAILAYFAFDCYSGRSHAVPECPFNDHFDREATDLHNIPIPFTTKGQVSHGHLGLDFLGMQSEWCVLSKIVYLISAKTTHKTNPKMQNVSFWDARKHKPGTFHETGFTLLKLEKMPETTDWDTSGLHDPVNADVVKFHKQMDPHIRKLYPKVKRIHWMQNVVRGGYVGSHPKAFYAHIDYHPNNTGRIEYHKDHPAFPTWIPLKSEPQIMMGAMDTEDSKFEVMLGVWKALSDEICDWPLATLDSRTMEPEYFTVAKSSINVLVGTYYNYGAGVAYSPKQKWYWHPYQNPDEVLIFHHFSKNRWLLNPHTSFLNKNCPKDTQTRKSVEFRVALFF